MAEQMNREGGTEVSKVVEELLQSVAATQRASVARSTVLAKVRARPPARRSAARRWMSRLSASGVALPRLRFALPMLAAAGICAVWWAQRPVPLTYAIGGSNGAVGGGGAQRAGQTFDAPASGPLPLFFSDGSAVTLQAEARVRVTELDVRGATVQLEKGRAEVSVHHRANTRWRLRAGTFEVTVTGTRFSIDWDDRSDALTVMMSEGTVEVRGGQLPGSAPVTVTAGQKFHAAAREARWTLAAANAGTEEPGPAPGGTGPAAGSVANAGAQEATTGSVPAPPGEDAPPPTEQAAPVVASRSTGSSSSTHPWQTLARAGRYEEALKAAERSGFAKACRKLSAEDLVQLGDVARLARNSARAEQAYQTARRRFPRNDRPAFALGLVAFEQRRDYRAAGKWFELYVRKYPKGALAREALGREMESWHRADEATRAKRTARLYLRQTPSGPYAPLAHQIVSP